MAAMLAVLACAWGCDRAPQVDFSVDKVALVTELGTGDLSSVWTETFAAVRKVIGHEERCKLKAISARFSGDGDFKTCEAVRKRCLNGPEVRLRAADHRDIRDLAGEHCAAAVGEVEACLNDALKNLSSGIRSIGCASEPAVIDHKLQVPESCRAIESRCIMPVLTAYFTPN